MKFIHSSMFHTYLKLLCSVANAVPNSRQNLKCHILAPNPILCCNLRFTKFLKCSSTLEVNNKWRFDHFSWPTTHGQPYCTDRSSLHWIISYYFAEVAKICPHARILLVKMKRKGIWNGLHQKCKMYNRFPSFCRGLEPLYCTFQFKKRTIWLLYNSVICLFVYLFQFWLPFLEYMKWGCYKQDISIFSKTKRSLDLKIK